MVIDIKTALNFINNNFENYTNKKFINKVDKHEHSYKFNKHNWCYNLFIHQISIIPNENIDILDTNKICIWNHHNLYDEDIINSINRRSLHLLECLEKKYNTMLLFYIEKIQQYDKEKKCYFNSSILNNYKCNFLILIPLLDFNSDPFLFYDNTKIRIIYFNSNLVSWATDIACHIEEWNKLQILINKLYDFNIENRNNMPEHE